MKRLFLMLLLSVVMAVSACAPVQEKARGDIELAFPPPPDEPKIKFVDMIISTLDLGKKKGIAEALFGEETVEGFMKPYGVAVDGEGKIYVTDVGKVLVLDMKAKEYFLIGAAAGDGQLRVPIGIAIASDGRVFVTDVAADKVYVYLKGKFLTAIGKQGEFESPSGVALDEKRGLVYIVDSKKHFVSVHSLKDYSSLRTLGKRGAEETGVFNYPTNIAVGSDGKVYVVDTGNFRLQVFDAEGNFVRVVGQVGDTPGSLARPKGIALDSEGHVYVIDAAFQNFQIFDQNGALLLAVGEGGMLLPGKFLLPAGIAIDHEDKIYVIDQYPGSVQIFQYLGEKWKQKQK